MAAICFQAKNYKNLAENYRKWPDRASQLAQEALEEFDPHSFDFGRWFEECFGWEEFRACRRNRQNPDRLAHQVFEAAGGVSTAAFKDISGQIVYAMTLPRYTAEEFAFSKMIPERQSPYTFEKVAGLSEIGPGADAEWVTAEGEPFNVAGIGQNWINMPETVKRGKIIPLTREALFFDRTGKIQEFCGQVGYWLGFLRERRAIDVVIDENEGAKSAAAGGHRYHWQGVSIATYGDNSGTHSWDNLAATNALVDWTDLDVADQLLNEIVDPFTGAPVQIMAMKLIVAKSLSKTALRIQSATQLHVVTPGYATSANPTYHDNPNPYAGIFEVVSTRLFAQRLGTDTSWFYGDPARAFQYVVNFPFQTIQAPPNSQKEFEQDIVMQWRADERGAYGTIDPRYMIKSTA